MATTYTYKSDNDVYTIMLDNDIYTVNDGNDDIFKIKKDIIEKLSHMISNGTLSNDKITDCLLHKGGNNKSKKIQKNKISRNRTFKIFM
jgi:hypothetical protein